MAMDYPKILEKVFVRYSENIKGIVLDRFRDFATRLRKFVPSEYQKPVSWNNNLSGVFAYFDEDSDGYLSKEEFDAWWYSSIRYTSLYLESELYDKAYILFRTYAKPSAEEKIQGIDVDSFHEMAGSRLGKNSTKKIENAFNKLDIDKNGILNFQEFCSWLNWFSDD